jgi:hypothetical protein
MAQKLYLLRYYLVFLGLAVFTWAVHSADKVEKIFELSSIPYFLGIIGLYGMSHLFRIIRLAILTLDERHKIFPLITAHALTAFPSSFMPFKIGELLRLGSFFYVYKTKQKALAIWLAERFGDISVISLFILGLYLFGANLPPTLHFILFIFLFFSVLGLLTFFAISKLSIFLNRYLVLSSHSKRGLMLLKISHTLRSLEECIYRSIEGRLVSLLLFSIIIWSLEILALVAFLKSNFYPIESLAQYFMAGLSGSLRQELINLDINFGIYQSLTLAILTALFVLFASLSKWLKNIRW